MESIDIVKLKEEIENQFSHIVDNVEIKFVNELRVHLIDKSFLDIWFSIKLDKRYSYHWERTKIDGKIYRHDNSPHTRWKHIETYPKHFHNGTNENVEESYISDVQEEAVIEMLTYIEEKINHSH